MMVRTLPAPGASVHAPQAALRAPMSVTVRQLRAAVAVAEHLNFRRAAETVHLSPPAVSAAIAELEQALGIVLFDRSSREVRPSAAGASFLQGAARLLAD